MEFRKLISFGKSSFVVSLPKNWVEKNKLSKGSVISVQEEEGYLKVSPDVGKDKQIETKRLDVSDFGQMTARVLHALYKQGVDDIHVTFNKPELLKDIQGAIGKEAVGLEIIEQSRDKCYIKNISSGLEGFDVLLRKTFLVLISMADESYEAIKTGELERISQIAFLEEANNRFTTSCRRIINKGGVKKAKHIGPLYYVVEDLENLADQYKYLCQYLAKGKVKKLKVRTEVMEVYAQVNTMLRDLYEVFYKLDHKKLSEMANERKKIIKQLLGLMESSKDVTETVIVHYLLVIVQKVFNFTGPLLTMNL